MANWPLDPFRLSVEERAHCVAAMRHGSTSFHAASLLLPTRIRLPARALYAFCRAGDDTVDLNTNGDCAANRLLARLDDIYAGQPGDITSDRAFAALVRAWSIPHAVPAAMIEGFQWDEAGRRYETLDALLDYCARVAGTVGVMMAILMGRRDHVVLARAADLGLAMQLTNIARDVGEDARQGRVYLPLDWLEAEGLSADQLIDRPRYTAALGNVVARLLAAADSYYARAVTGLASLPADCRPAILAAALVYREIGRGVAANGFNSVDDRAYTTSATKLRLAARAVGGWAFTSAIDEAPAHASTLFLVEAAAIATRKPLRGFDAKVDRAMELLTLLGTREREWTAEVQSGS